MEFAKNTLFQNAIQTLSQLNSLPLYSQV